MNNTAFDPRAAASAMRQANRQNPVQNGAGTGEDRPKAELYLAIGTLVEGADSNNVDLKNDVIYLPQTFGLDTMKPDTRNASTSEFKHEQTEKNQLLEDLVADALAKMEPGQEELLSTFVVVVRRKREEVQVTAPVRRAASFL